jgi:hypothetical protein
MKRRLYIALGILLACPLISAQQKAAPAAANKDQKIMNAMQAAPSSVASKATVMDWPAKEGGKPPVLRQGSNGWTCFPDFAGTEGNDPMCLDEPWMAWMNAYMAHKPPQTGRVGIAYMIAPGGAWGSNTDPYATKETASNEWGFDPPHTMVLAPNADALKGLPTDRKSGGPWVMYRGTPYAHIMVPISSVTASSPAKK